MKSITREEKKKRKGLPKGNIFRHGCYVCEGKRKKNNNLNIQTGETEKL